MGLLVFTTILRTKRDKKTSRHYLVGVGVSWKLSNMDRVSSRLKSQRYYADGLTNEYHYQETNLTNQLEEGNKQLINALQKYREAPILLKAASGIAHQPPEWYLLSLFNYNNHEFITARTYPAYRIRHVVIIWREESAGVNERPRHRD